ncbi:MAG: hypothetical protein KDA22_00830 [Phycisphaerales bacterium]|nr:hypothetical protein [Phycisphaerales bacterium]
MRRASTNSPRFLLAATLLIVVAALLPTRWLLPWTNDVAAVVNLPLAPLAEAAEGVRRWLRPERRLDSEGTDAELRLVEERDLYRSLWHAERLRTQQLEDLLQDFQLTAGRHRGGEFVPVAADVTGRSPERMAGVVRLNVGARNGVQAGDVAVYRGSHLIGRVAEEVTRLSSWLTPTIDPVIGRLECILLPPDGQGGIEEGRRVLLTPSGDGTFAADADLEWNVQVGDEAILDDPAWPSGGQGMTVGYVEDIRRRDDQPLRNRLVIRPRYDAHHVASVVVKAEAPPPDTRGGS